MASGNIQCDYKRIYPVRYALTSEEIPPINNESTFDTGVKLISQDSLSSYQYTLRTLRPGYIHIYLPTSNEHRSYAWTNGSFNPVIRESPTSPEASLGDGSGGTWIRIPEDEDSIYINYAEVLWDEEFWKNQVLAGGLKEERMMQVTINPDAPAQHTALAEKMDTLVEEHRKESMGYLESMREFLSDIFRPDLAYQKQTPNLESVKLNWQHSGVTLATGRDVDEDSYQQKTIWNPEPPQLKDITPNCGINPLLVAVYDPIGVGRDAARIYGAAIASIQHFAEWYSQPHNSARYLQLLESDYARIKRDGDIIDSVHVSLREFIHFPEKKPWQEFLDKFDRYSKAMELHLECYCESWHEWLGRTGTDSLHSAFKDYPVYAWEKKEIAFAACHLVLSSHPTGVNLTNLLYFNTSTGRWAELLTEVLQAGNNSASDATGDIILFLFNSLVPFVEKNQGFGYLEQAFVARLGGTRINSPTTMRQALDQLRKDANKINNQDLIEFLDTIMSAPPPQGRINGATLYQRSPNKLWEAVLSGESAPTIPNPFELGYTPQQERVSVYLSTLKGLVMLLPGLKDAYSEPNFKNISALTYGIIAVAGAALWQSRAVVTRGIGFTLIKTAFIGWFITFFMNMGERKDRMKTPMGIAYISIGAIITLLTIKMTHKTALKLAAGAAAGSGPGAGALGLLIFAHTVLDIYFIWSEPTKVEKWMSTCFWNKKTNQRGACLWDFTYAEWDPASGEERRKKGEQEVHAIDLIIRTPSVQVRGDFPFRDFHPDQKFVIEVSQLIFDYQDGELEIDINLHSSTSNGNLKLDLQRHYGSHFTTELIQTESGLIYRYTFSREKMWAIVLRHTGRQVKKDQLTVFTVECTAKYKSSSKYLTNEKGKFEDAVQPAEYTKYYSEVEFQERRDRLERGETTLEEIRNDPNAYIGYQIRIPQYEDFF